MKTNIQRIFFVLLIIANFATCGKDKNPVKNEEDDIVVPEGYKLVWNDEFNGTEIDLTKWEHEVNAQGGGNNELQYYTDRKINSYIEDGKLIIQALKETYTGPEGTREYTSARLRTAKKGDWKYGRFEIKATLPHGQGLWPAIWMLPTDWKYGGWAASGEIDIMELIGHKPNEVFGTLHYGGEYPNNVHTGKSDTLTTGNFSENFHVFILEWEEKAFRWYVDDIYYQTQTTWHSDNADYPAPFDQFFHLLLNVAVGGNWPGKPDNTTVFPQRMVVDYVRVFKKE
ncbi:glycoside hydrolase family 16 protein [candidate division KSB1 bacterium]|nr:glycoside hydrolase family 16 protein [candidate division KSB1 bacterium]